jgi:hypothetical protein
VSYDSDSRNLQIIQKSNKIVRHGFVTVDLSTFWATLYKVVDIRVILYQTSPSTLEAYCLSESAKIWCNHSVAF